MDPTPSTAGQVIPTSGHPKYSPNVLLKVVMATVPGLFPRKRITQLHPSVLSAHLCHEDRDCLHLSHANSTQGKGGRQQHPVLNTSPTSSFTTPPKPSQRWDQSREGAGEQHQLCRSESSQDMALSTAPCTHGMIKCFGLDGTLQIIYDKDHIMPRNPSFPCSHTFPCTLSSPSRYTQLRLKGKTRHSPALFACLHSQVCSLPRDGF